MRRIQKHIFKTHQETQETVVGMMLVTKFKGMLAVQPHIDFIPVTNAVPGAGL